MTGELSPADRPLPQIRVSHADRDRVVDILRVAAGDGRLTAEELDERLEAALTARTESDLAVLTADLPAVPGQPGEVVPEAKKLMQIDCGSGSAKRVGRWIVPERADIRVTSGNVKLDFTEALITKPTLQLEANVKSGSLVLITKPGIVVDVDNVAVNSGSVTVRPPKGPQPPTILRVEVTGQVRSGSLVARLPRRTLWQWLLRRPPRWQAAEGYRSIA
jgi:DUF1707 SHOCT-like domain